MKIIVIVSVFAIVVLTVDAENSTASARNGEVTQTLLQASDLSSENGRRGKRVLAQPIVPKYFYVTMNSEKRTEAVTSADTAMKAFSHTAEIARHIKTTFDAKYPKFWQCIVSDANFGSYVEHNTYDLIYYKMGSLYILLWKTDFYS